MSTRQRFKKKIFCCWKICNSFLAKENNNYIYFIPKYLKFWTCLILTFSSMFMWNSWSVLIAKNHVLFKLIVKLPSLYVLFSLFKINSKLSASWAVIIIIIIIIIIINEAFYSETTEIYSYTFWYCKVMVEMPQQHAGVNFGSDFTGLARYRVLQRSYVLERYWGEV